MNSTQVVRQIVLGTMEKGKAGKELRMNQVGGGVLPFRIDWSRKTCLICWRLSRGLQEMKQQTCRYLWREPPGNTKQGRGPQGSACLMHLEGPWGGHYGWNGVGKERMVGPATGGLAKGEGRGQACSLVCESPWCQSGPSPRTSSAVLGAPCGFRVPALLFASCAPLNIRLGRICIPVFLSEYSCGHAESWQSWSTTF